MRKLFFILSIIWTINLKSQSVIYKTINSKVSFISEAPLEIIKANSRALTGVLNKTTNSFSFKVRLKSFEGFNSPLQKEHFFENYMEVDKNPEASFSGKIIEPIIDGNSQQFRVKGILTIHGVSREAIIS
ncbi:MAG: hypothetical protein RLZZ546_1251, partial [Bacteroidota bacterium]